MRNRSFKEMWRQAESRSAGAKGNLVIMALLLLNLSEARACLAPDRPREDAEYKTIVLAEVVGVRLTGEPPL